MIVYNYTKIIYRGGYYEVLQGNVEGRTADT